MPDFLRSRGLNVALRLFLGGLFIYAAWDQIARPHEFAIAVRSYEMIPVSVSGLFALGVCWSEMVAGVMLILGIYTRKAAGALLLLSVMFTFAIAAVLIRGMVIDCGCFGAEEKGTSTVSFLMIVRNVLLVAFAWLIIRYNDGFASLFPGARRETATA